MNEGAPADGFVRSVLDIVAAGVEVRLIGQPLSGKSATVRRLEILAGERGLQTTTVRGIAPLRSLPYGALTAAGIGLGSGGSATFPDALSDLSGANRLLMVDDVDLIDDLSLGAVLAAAQRSGRPLVTTSRRAGVFDGARPSTIVNVPAATYVDTLALVGAELGGQVAPSTVRRVHGKSGGLRGLAVHLVKIARLEGTIRSIDGVWTATDRLWTPSMQGLVTPYLDGLSTSHIAALRELISVQPPYVLGAREAVGDDTYTWLRDEGRLREFTIAGSRMFTVFPSLLAEHFRSTAQGVEERLGYTDVATLSNFAQMDWRREIDNVARQVDQPASPATIIRTLRMAIATGADIDPATFTHTLAGTSPEDASAALWEAFLWIVRGDEARADETFARTLAAHPHLAGFTDSARAHAAFALHSDAGAADDAPPVGGHDLNDDGWAIVRAETALAAGRIADARVALDHLSGSGSAYFSSFGDALTCLSLLIEGQLEEAASRSLSAIEVAIEQYNLESISMYGYTAAISLYTAGRDDELLAVLDLLLSIVVRTPSMHGSYTQGILGCAASQSSDDRLDASAEGLATQMSIVSERPGAWPFASRAFALGVVRNTAIDFGPAREEAEHHLDSGLITSGLVHEAIIGWLQPALVDTTRVRNAVDQTDSPLLRALGGLALAAAARDEPELTRLADELAVLGAHRAALGARIAIAAGADTELQPARAFGALSWALQKGLSPGLIKRVIPMQWIFTEREIDIVPLASAGWTTKDIASHLAISSRTVEGHLSAVYRKLGIASRAELPPCALFD
ncbi:LuxR C-terminal-related transcriptional regulator [Microbacterium sp. KKR3/1]|uniref:helix-turn-helix transcriptional regulator n=1 Tax=Microbacterium sp. KKR3/1 TaxID=2904241 RepID=UPI001E644B5B|nr:helix-turn-helix transcriptional regulator [Microbacterium sp. KKR3/1]MCE0510782.1 LuxR C-terminal-related transcriptional regulator [Microbacterium sp. KKR3/1]